VEAGRVSFFRAATPKPKGVCAPPSRGKNRVPALCLPSFFPSPAASCPAGVFFFFFPFGRDSSDPNPVLTVNGVSALPVVVSSSSREWYSWGDYGAAQSFFFFPKKRPFFGASPLVPTGEEPTSAALGASLFFFRELFSLLRVIPPAFFFSLFFAAPAEENGPCGPQVAAADL